MKRITKNISYIFTSLLITALLWLTPTQAEDKKCLKIPLPIKWSKIAQLQHIIEQRSRSEEQRIKDIRGTTVRMYQAKFAADKNTWIKTEAVANCRALLVITSKGRRYIAHMPPNAHVHGYLPTLEKGETAFFEISHGPQKDLRKNNPELNTINDKRFTPGFPKLLVKRKFDTRNLYGSSNKRKNITYINLAISPYQKGQSPPFTILYEESGI